MGFNLDIDVIGINILHEDEEAPNAHLTLLAGFDAPIPTPKGLAAIRAPFATIRSPIDRDGLETIIEQATKALESLPEPQKQSDLVVAGNMAEAKNFADTLQAANGAKV